MKRLLSRIIVCFVSMVLAMGASGCGLLVGSARAEISETIDLFFEDVTSGIYAEDGFISDYATDDPFSSIEIEDERVWVYIEKGLTLISYQIEDARGKKSDGIGECTVIIEMVDIAAVFEDLLENEYEHEAFLEAMSERRVPTIEIEVVFDLEYNSRRDEWLISDSSEFVQEFTEPFLMLSLPSSQDPESEFADFFAALRVRDFDLLDQLYPSLWDLLYIWDAMDEALYLELFRAMDYQVLDTHIEDDTATLTILFEVPDVSFIEHTLADEQVLIAALREMHMTLYYGDLYTDEDLVNFYSEIFIDILINREFEVISSESSVTMKYNHDTDIWTDLYFADLESFIFHYQMLGENDPFEFIEVEEIQREVLVDLINEGLISEDYYTYWYGQENGYYDGSDASAEDIYSDIVRTYWMHEDQEYVEYYVAGDTSVIQYGIDFRRMWDNVDLVVSFYYDDGDELYPLYDFDFSLSGEDYSYSFWYGYADGSDQLPVGTYYILVELDDGDFIYSDLVDIR